jgi:hypothetical protein
LNSSPRLQPKLKAWLNFRYNASSLPNGAYAPKGHGLN